MSRCHQRRDLCDCGCEGYGKGWRNSMGPPSRGQGPWGWHHRRGNNPDTLSSRGFGPDRVLSLDSRTCIYIWRTGDPNYFQWHRCEKALKHDGRIVEFITPPVGILCGNRNVVLIEMFEIPPCIVAVGSTPFDGVANTMIVHIGILSPQAHCHKHGSHHKQERFLRFHDYINN